MENKIVKIIINDNEICFNTNNPNINDLIHTIVDLRDSIDVNSIKVDSDDAAFDVNGFTSLIKDSVKEFLDGIKLEKEQYDAAIAEWRK